MPNPSVQNLRKSLPRNGRNLMGNARSKWCPWQQRRPPNICVTSKRNRRAISNMHNYHYCTPERRGYWSRLSAIHEKPVVVRLHGHHFWRGLDFEDFCRTIWHPFCVKKAKPAPTLKSGCRIKAQKNTYFFSCIQGPTKRRWILKCPSRRHFMGPQRDEKVENRAKKVENLKVARAIVPKIV